MSPGSEFWTANKTLKNFHESNYFKEDKEGEEKESKGEWPQVLKDMLEDGDSLGMEPSEKYQHAISALGEYLVCSKKMLTDV